MRVQPLVIALCVAKTALAIPSLQLEKRQVGKIGIVRQPASTSTSSTKAVLTPRRVTPVAQHIVPSSTHTTSTSTHPSSTSIHSSTSSTSLHTTSSSSHSTTTTTTTSSHTTTTTTTATSQSQPTPTPTPNAGTRGLSFNNATYTQPFSLSGQNSQVSWAFNWASGPYYPSNAATGTAILNPALEFVPMLWSDNIALTSIWNGNVATAEAKYGAKHLLAFNEPDACGDGQACMNATDAATSYKKYLQPYAGQLLLGAPAVTQNGLQWLSDFLGNCTACQVDFIPVHFYGSVLSPSDFTNFVTGVYKEFDKPVWVTEFGTTSGTEAQVLSWLESCIAWLDGAGKAYVQRYAYFMDGVVSPGWDYGLINAAGTGLSAIGLYYNNNTVVPATF